MGCTSSKPGQESASVPANGKEEVKSAEVKTTEPTFTVELQRKAESEEAGIKVEYPDDKVLRVTLVKEKGLIVNWNSKQEADSELCVRVGDSIVAVNDVSGDAVNMLEAFKKVGALVLKLQRVPGQPVAVEEGKGAVAQPGLASGASTQEPAKAEEQGAEVEVSGAASTPAVQGDQQQEQVATDVAPAIVEERQDQSNAEGQEAKVEVCGTAQEQPVAVDDANVEASGAATSTEVVATEAAQESKQGEQEKQEVAVAEVATKTEEQAQQPAKQDVAACVVDKQQSAIQDGSDSITVEPEAAENNASSTKTCVCF